MRHALLATALLLLAAPLAQAKDFSMAMPTHREFVQACVESALEDEGSSVEEASDGLVGVATMQCQCMFTKMPPEGTNISRTMVSASSATCEEEFDDNQSRFVVRYSNSFYHAIGAHDQETEEGDW